MGLQEEQTASRDFIVALLKNLEDRSSTPKELEIIVEQILPVLVPGDGERDIIPGDDCGDADGIDEPELTDPSSSLTDADEFSADCCFESVPLEWWALSIGGTPEGAGVGRNAGSRASRLKLSSASSMGRSSSAISSCSSDGTSAIIWFDTGGIMGIMGIAGASGTAAVGATSAFSAVLGAGFAGCGTGTAGAAGSTLTGSAVGSAVATGTAATVATVSAGIPSGDGIGAAVVDAAVVLAGDDCRDECCAIKKINTTLVWQPGRERPINSSRKSIIPRAQGTRTAAPAARPGAGAHCVSCVPLRLRRACVLATTATARRNERFHPRPHLQGLSAPLDFLNTPFCSASVGFCSHTQSEPESSLPTTSTRGVTPPGLQAHQQQHQSVSAISLGLLHDVLLPYQGSTWGWSGGPPS
ncbi:unnamed protein product [Phytophthora fragariaefolia]|uniref:Unnamed protein product n=1 Tax=Phytophthora fragariaefolia TaxID=1490495 RepID=A0A9W6TSS5_9STRA|nr:unnamed protein product [Phytophthora fragariaefolia]